MANNRNKMCSCGSGKKYKKCCINKKKREEYIYICSQDPIEAIYYNVNGEIKIRKKDGSLVEPEQVFTQKSYLKDNGKSKIINRVSNLAIKNIHEYISTFDLVFAIDTNTKEINSELISVAGLVEIKIEKEMDKHRIKLSTFEIGLLFFKNCNNLHPEKYAWLNFFSIIQKREDYSSDLKIAIITDHELGNHTEYNKGVLPIYKDQSLPKNFSLIFATSDSKNDGILNSLVSHCDKMATDSINNLEREGKVTVEGYMKELNTIIDASNY